LKADGHRSMGVRRTHSPLFISSKSLCPAIYRQPLEGASGISLYLDISAVFQDIAEFLQLSVELLECLKTAQ